MNPSESALVGSFTSRIGPLDARAMRAARERQSQLAKPPGSLGRLEELSIKLAGITGQARPHLPRKAVIVLAADHGVAVEGVSAYPQAVTPQMVANFLAGGAAINVLARRSGARVIVADVGVAADLADQPGLISRKIRYGTRNMAEGPAMSTDESLAAITIGAEIVAKEIELGLDIVATGDMGIGNTAASSAIVAALTGCAVRDVTGRGTGLDDAGWKHKVAVIALSRRMHWTFSRRSGAMRSRVWSESSWKRHRDGSQSSSTASSLAPRRSSPPSYARPPATT
ncbi:MAG: nicotinate-nucleotide/dimethylbenzimidazole phosphoribosyltransferase [Chloroflexi bacterium]|nr:nicotinate-nucleotide/dimethylbenzimidazole phosphoribosyltransferase [Chloroflexota bacterium]